MPKNLDKKDLEILDLLQKNCKLTTKEMARHVGSPVTTVYAKIKKLEEQGFIKGYKAILDAEKLDKATTAFILASFSYRTERSERSPSQRELARQISRFPEVQEVHIITGDWDILVKVKAKDVDAVGKFVIDKLRLVEGVEKTLTCMVFSTEKESTEIPLDDLIKTAT